jgi:hypothetical protein
MEASIAMTPATAPLRSKISPIAPPISPFSVSTPWQQLSVLSVPPMLDGPPGLVMEGLEKMAGPITRALSSSVMHSYLSRGPPVTISFS